MWRFYLLKHGSVKKKHHLERVGERKWGSGDPFFPVFIQIGGQQPSCFITNTMEEEKLETLGKCPLSKYLSMS